MPRHRIQLDAGSALTGTCCAAHTHTIHETISIYETHMVYLESSSCHSTEQHDAAIKFGQSYM